ncbi:MAG: nucleotidyl transferase AbiEii/AbiGii toxin family protein [Ignavibacteriaceae bacterium]|nr:nucleotidyl transferase AbiEii/AbiGii toxin family protein [Ignavibacteriaceae bacterium]
MIPKQYITEWSATAPWVNNYQIEQDLIIERCIVEIFSDELLREKLAFRGGTALHKIFFSPQVRYSEDIDLVQISNEEIGMVLTRLRERLSFLGQAGYKRAEHNNTLIYKFRSEFENIPLKLKVEINTREHFSVFGYKEAARGIQSEYLSGTYKVKTFQIEELLATKLRALYQRSKGRDLFDIWFALKYSKADTERIIFAFGEYMSAEGHKVSQREFLINLTNKLADINFLNDVSGLLRPGVEYNAEEALEDVVSKIIRLL